MFDRLGHVQSPWMRAYIIPLQDALFYSQPSTYFNLTKAIKSKSILASYFAPQQEI